MSLDWLYNAITVAWNNFNNWLGEIGQSLNSTYGQLGAGIVGGLSAIANALIQFFQSVYNAITYFSDKFYDAISYLGTWITNGISFIGTGIGKIAENLYQVGMMIWNGIVDFVNGFISVVENGINWIIQQATNVYNTIKDWIPDTLNSFNTWWTNLITSMRNKIKLTIRSNIIIYFTWKSMSKMSEAKGLWDFIRPLGVLFTSTMMGEVFSNVVDTMIPQPSTTPIPIIPTVSLPDVSLSQISIPRLSYGGTPIQPAPMPPVYVGYVPVINLEVGLGTFEGHFIPIFLQPKELEIPNLIETSHTEIYSDNLSENTVEVMTVSYETETSS